MKFMKPAVCVILLMVPFYFPNLLQADYNALMTELKNVDAIQAVALANKWKWTEKNIKSYVNSQEIVFNFPDGQVKKIPLPKDKMLIAVAPYIKDTHT